MKASFTNITSFSKRFAFWAFFMSFFTVAVMNQQPFVKDLTSNSRTAEVLLESNSLTLMKKWNVLPNFIFDSDAPDLVFIKNYEGKIYYPTQDLDKPTNICVFEHFNIPPPRSFS